MEGVKNTPDSATLTLHASNNYKRPKPYNVILANFIVFTFEGVGDFIFQKGLPCPTSLNHTLSVHVAPGIRLKGVVLCLTHLMRATRWDGSRYFHKKQS